MLKSFFSSLRSVQSGGGGLKRPQSNSGFTLVEILIVIVIISILVLVAVTDYGFATQKSRLQISSEQLVSLLGEASVNSQSGIGTSNNSVSCYGVFVGQGELPALWQVVWDGENQQCDVNSIENKTSLRWASSMEVDLIEWSWISSADEFLDDAGSFLFMFEPPSGNLSLYSDLSLPPLVNVQQVLIDLNYGGSTNPVLQKTIKVVPITSTFDII